MGQGQVGQDGDGDGAVEGVMAVKMLDNVVPLGIEKLGLLLAELQQHLERVVAKSVLFGLQIGKQLIQNSPILHGQGRHRVQVGAGIAREHGPDI